MKISKLIYFRADNGSVEFKIEFDQAKHLIRQITNWRVTQKEPCLVQRLYKQGTYEYNKIVTEMYKRMH